MGYGSLSHFWNLAFLALLLSCVPIVCGWGAGIWFLTTSVSPSSTGRSITGAPVVPTSGAVEFDGVHWFDWVFVFEADASGAHYAHDSSSHNLTMAAISFLNGAAFGGIP